ncbi:hypothetical protein FACS1894127_5050 [Clostridia bacterium]|nr:hypothetical protein FACS1894127_5050 [Clostridia bacterium]
MVKGNKRKILSLLLTFSLMFSVFAVSATAIDTPTLNDSISTSDFPLNNYEKDLSQELSIDSRLSVKYTDFLSAGVDFSPEFKLAAAQDVNVSLIVASYDSKSRLVELAKVDKKLQAGENAVIQATLPYGEELSYRYFLWDDKFAPLTAATDPRMLTNDEEAIRLLSIDDTMNILKHLSKDIGNRTRGTSGEERAVDYMISEYAKLGLKTEKHQFVSSTAQQYFGYLTVHDAEKFYGLGAFDNGKGAYNEWHGSVWQVGAAANAVFTGTTGPAISGEVVFVGAAGVSPTQAAFNAAGLEGKIALIGVNANAIMVTYARNAGAIGLMGFSTALGGRGNFAQVSNPTVTTGTPIPVLGLARCQGEWMMAMIKKDKVLVDIKTERIPTPYSWNSIGIKPAKINPETAPIFMVTSHIDSVLGSPGGNDDGSGSAVTLEAAKALSKLNTDKVELRFVNFGSEEGGMRGSTQYVATLTPAERARVKGVFQMDMTATSDVERASSWCMMTTNGQPNLVTNTFLATANRVGYGSSVELGQFSSSDHVPFSNAGMPAAMGMWFGRPAGYTGTITPSNYTIESHYHTPLDTIEDNVSVERMKMCIEVVTAAVYDMALNYVEAPAAIAPLFTRFAAPIADPYEFILTGDYIDKQLAKLAAEEAAAAEAADIAARKAETDR